MHRAMPQPARMNLAPGVLANHLVAFVDDIENFIRSLRVFHSENIYYRQDNVIGENQRSLIQNGAATGL